MFVWFFQGFYAHLKQPCLSADRFEVSEHIKGIATIQDDKFFWIHSKTAAVKTTTNQTFKWNTIPSHLSWLNLQSLWRSFPHEKHIYISWMPNPCWQMLNHYYHRDKLSVVNVFEIAISRKNTYNNKRVLSQLCFPNKCSCSCWAGLFGTFGESWWNHEITHWLTKCCVC